MTKVTTSFLMSILGIFVSATFFSANAQPVPTPKAQTNLTVTQSQKLEAGQKRQMDFVVRELGSVAGRVFDESAGNSTTGLQGVKVSLRSRDKGFELFVIEQFTDEEGKYTFEYLPPGKYVIEIDSTNLPSNSPLSADLPTPVRNSGPKVADPVIVAPEPVQTTTTPATISRVINGSVFIDNNGDGLYQPGKDEPIKGAYVVGHGVFTVTNASGGYTLKDLPEGRIALLVSSPHRSETAHVVLDLGDGRVTNRIVDIPLGR